MKENYTPLEVLESHKKLPILFALVALLSFSFLTVNAFAGTGELPDSPYSAKTITKPLWFINLQGWVSQTYQTDLTSGIHWLPETLHDISLQEGSGKGQPAIAFETYELDGYRTNTLVDGGDKLYLYTIKDPAFKAAQASESAYASASSCDKCNCVLWVRCARAPWLPSGMTYIWDKKSKINTSTPKAGRVAVHDIYYPYGHVSYITSVNGNKIYIDEANYTPCKATSRSGSASSMKIVGYIK